MKKECYEIYDLKQLAIDDLLNRINNVLKLIDERVEDYYGIIDVSLVWEIERILRGEQ